MKPLAQATGCATVAWGPTSSCSSFLAAATVAGAVDDTFTSSATVSIYGMDSTGRFPDLALKGSVESSEKCLKLAWSGRSAADSTGPVTGILAGGLTDGTISLWNTAAIVG